MSVPIDRLYHYLYSSVKHNTIIYHWSPHGSTKLEDLQGLNPCLSTEWHTSPIVYCHDQEPVDMHRYNQNSFLDYCKVFPERISGTIVKHPKAFNELHPPMLGILSWLNLHDNTILTHSERNSKDIEFYKSQGFIDVHFWSHAILARDWFRFAEHDNVINHCEHAYDFLIYNRAWDGSREYRLYFSQLLADNNLQQSCLTTFSPEINNIRYTEHQFCNPSLQTSRRDLEHVFFLNTHPSSASADYTSKDYQLTSIEVVLETIFDNQKVHLTEKSLRPIACGKPFILASSANSLEYIRSYGFKTFAPYIDESYDQITDSKERLHAIIKEMARISQLPASEKNKLQENLKSIAAFNKEHFFSNAFNNFVLTEMTTNFSNAVETVLNNKNCYKWNKTNEFINKYLSDRVDLIFPKHHDGMSEYQWLCNWIKNNKTTC